MRKAITVVLVTVLIGGLFGCATRGTRQNPNTETVSTHEFNATDLQLISKKAVKDMFAMDVFRPGARVVLYVARIDNLTDEHINGTAIREYIAVEAGKNPRVRLVARNAARDEALNELGLQQDPTMDPTTAKRIGKQVGASHFLQGMLTNMESAGGGEKGQYFLFVLTLIDIETLDSYKSMVEIKKLSKHTLEKKYKKSRSCV